MDAFGGIGRACSFVLTCFLMDLLNISVLVIYWWKTFTEIKVTRLQEVLCLQSRLNWNYLLNSQVLLHKCWQIPVGQALISYQFHSLSNSGFCGFSILNWHGLDILVLRIKSSCKAIWELNVLHVASPCDGGRCLGFWGKCQYWTGWT